MIATPSDTKANTVEAALIRWRKLQGVGKTKGTLRFHDDLEQVIRSTWPDLQKPVCEVTEDDCIAFVERIKHYSVMRYNALKYALRKMIPAAKCIPRRRYVPPEKHLPTEEQYNRLLAALDVAYRGHAGLVVRFLAHTGLRINEAKQLRWESVREDHIYVPADVTKNGKPRCVPFIKGMVELLDILRRTKAGSETRNGFILPQAECGKTLRFASRLAGIPRVTHHTFRHFYATKCIQSGVDIPTVAKWLGHSDHGALLLRTYCHLLDEHGFEMAKKVKMVGLAPIDPAAPVATVEPPPEPAAPPMPEETAAAPVEIHARERMSFHFAA